MLLRRLTLVPRFAFSQQSVEGTLRVIQVTSHQPSPIPPPADMPAPFLALLPDSNASRTWLETSPTLKESSRSLLLSEKS